MYLLWPILKGLCLSHSVHNIKVNPSVEIVNCKLGDIRLVDGNSAMEGRVEVCFGGIWGTICADNWDNSEAGVICYQLFNSTYGELFSLGMFIL